MTVTLVCFVWHRKVCKWDAIGSSTTAKNVVVLVSQELFTTVSHICYTRRTLVERQLNMNLHATLLMHQYTFIQLVEGEVLLRALTWSEPHSLHFLGLQLALLYQPRDHGAAEAPVRLQLAQVIHLKQALTRGDLRHHFAMSQCYSGTMVSSFILWGRQLPSLRELTHARCSTYKLAAASKRINRLSTTRPQHHTHSVRLPELPWEFGIMEEFHSALQQVM